MCNFSPKIHINRIKRAEAEMAEGMESFLDLGFQAQDFSKQGVSVSFLPFSLM